MLCAKPISDGTVCYCSAVAFPLCRQCAALAPSLWRNDWTVNIRGARFTRTMDGHVCDSVAFQGWMGPLGGSVFRERPTPHAPASHYSVRRCRLKETPYAPSGIAWSRGPRHSASKAAVQPLLGYTGVKIKFFVIPLIFPQENVQNWYQKGHVTEGGHGSVPGWKK